MSKSQIKFYICCKFLGYGEVGRVLSMIRGREVEDKEVNIEEMEGNDSRDDKYESVLEEIDLNVMASDKSRPNKIRRFDLNLEIESQDADYYPNIPHLGDELPRIPREVKTMIMARIPLLEMRTFCLLNKRISALIKNGGLVRERKEIGVREASVFMLASGENNWWAFDNRFSTRKTLPNLPSDDTFKRADKESVCAGTHLLVIGKEAHGPVIWTYELLVNKWVKGSLMNEPRCLFASASSGDFAYVAGGTCLGTFGTLNSAEKYDPGTKSWVPLPKMKEKRKMCAGFYMDDKFHVVGGQSQSGEALTCAEVFDEVKNTWIKIPGILNGLTVSASPPLVAVVKNELYTFETSTNSLMLYLKDSNCWKDLGPIPVRADSGKGWGVAFKSLGDELLAIGGSSILPWGRGMTVYTCSPKLDAEGLDWKLLDDGRNSRSAFVMNCTVMIA
ncbi:hypothetical protein RND81_11G200200 [Saponaria officinalis]|uniref:F-box domain-containing protein n=1 Tax=Saponaria officinalis TaxID=3572 RepID=A0AAW1HPU3_SAPOF